MNIVLLKDACAEVRTLLPGAKPVAAIILGSGWGGLSESFNTEVEIPYSRIPSLGATGVRGHSGNLILSASPAGQILVFLGRRHWYEGAGWEPVVAPVVIAREMGAGIVIVTNAAGAVRESFNRGDLMAISDHINFMGAHPLTGPHDAFLGPRFPDQTEVYDIHLRNRVINDGQDAGVSISKGVYAATAGPVYETPAEISALRTLGADAVGMSTVPEASVAHAIGMRVAGISCITNMAAGLSNKPLSHDEVVHTASATASKMNLLFDRLFSRPLHNGR